MSKSHNNNFENIAREHSVLLNEYGRVQSRCSELVARQVDQIEALRAELSRKQGEIMRLRAAVIARDTELAFAREDKATLEATIPGLATRLSLVRRVESLTEHIQSLMRERLGWQWLAKPARAEHHAPHPVIPADLRQKSVLCIGKDESGTSVAQMEVERAGGYFLHHDGSDSEDETALEASLVAADLVICQTGCVSHNAYWRIQDHCKRTGKQCVLVNQPRALHFVRDADDLLAVSAKAQQAAYEIADMPGSGK
ncbi:hypothetical protein D3C72_130250 [compost metagenome]